MQTYRMRFRCKWCLRFIRSKRTVAVSLITSRMRRNNSLRGEWSIIITTIHILSCITGRFLFPFCFNPHKDRVDLSVIQILSRTNVILFFINLNLPLSIFTRFPCSHWCSCSSFRLNWNWSILPKNWCSFFSFYPWKIPRHFRILWILCPLRDLLRLS